MEGLEVFRSHTALHKDLWAWKEHAKLHTDSNLSRGWKQLGSGGGITALPSFDIVFQQVGFYIKL